MVTTTYVPSNYAASPNQDSNLLHQSPGTKLFVNNQELGTGTLYINKSNVTWTSAMNSQTALRRISLLYPTISFYGTQKVPTPVLLMVINYELRSMLPELLSQENEDDSESDEECSITELKFVPQCVDDLEKIHLALDEGQKLHPDPADEITDEEGDSVDIFEEANDSEFDDDIEALYHLYQLQLNQNPGDCIEEYSEDDEEDRGR